MEKPWTFCRFGATLPYWQGVIMSESYQRDADRYDLLNKIKEQFNFGATRAALYNTSTDPQKPVYQWLHDGGGMGGPSFYPAKPQEIQAAKDLLHSGLLVEDIAEYFYYAGNNIFPIKHFEDINFGITSSDEVIIYKLNERAEGADTYKTLDSNAPAVEELLRRFEHGKAIADTFNAIVLREGPAIDPVITNPNLIALRKRHMEINTL
jgi:hypothetical protein